MNNTTNIELSEIKPLYKFTINQKEEMLQAKDWMLAKYKNVNVIEDIEMIEGKPQTIITLTSKTD